MEEQSNKQRMKKTWKPKDKWKPHLRNDVSGKRLPGQQTLQSLKM